MASEDEAYIQVDQLGTEMASGGMNSTLRDAARFAEVIRKAASGDPPDAIAGKAVRIALKAKGKMRPLLWPFRTAEPLPEPSLISPISDEACRQESSGIDCAA